MGNYRLKAHESFILRDGWLTKSLIALDKDPKLFQLNSGADALGVGTNMAKSIRYWLRAAGLSDDKASQGVYLTKLGKLILDADRYIEQDFTLFIIHSNIVRNFEQATSWNVFFNDFELTSFDRDALVNSMKELLIERTGETKLSYRSIIDDCNAILSMYCSKVEETDPEEKRISPFSGLGFITQNGKLYEKSSPSNKKLDSDAFLYTISDILSQNGSLLIDEIVNGQNMPGRVFNLGRIQVNSYLDELADNDYITVNRTAGLDIIYPKSLITGTDIVRTHYEE